MTRLLIAEKPSVAKDIARVLGAGRRREGYLEGPGWIVTWCIGHLVELIEPHEYVPEWKRWSLATLPMLPDEFRLRPVQSTRDQFEIVKRLLNGGGIDEVVNGCDAGREGELIFRYVYQLAGARVPIKRLWISSMTDQAIQEGLAALRPAAQYQRLFEAARCRSEADWLVGLNATRAITVRSRQGQPYSKDAPLYSVGRVQTPTLALIVDREKEITDFTPRNYWQLLATFDSPKGRYTGRWFRRAVDAARGADDRPGHQTPTLSPTEGGAVEGATGGGQPGIVDRFDLEADALAIRDKVLGRTGQVLEVEQKRSREAPPLLFDLTRLQRTANKRYGFSAARTLEIAQALYERHKLLTYPRTDSTHLGSDMVKGLKGTIAALQVEPYRPFAERLLQLEKLPISKRFVDDKKVSDHHAIIPTPNRPRLEALDNDERKIYDLVVRRFLGIFFPDAMFDKTKVITGVEGETFITRGKVMVDPGWREVAGFKDDEPKKKEPNPDPDAEGEDDEDQGALPPLKRGDPATAVEVELQKKQTQPPPRHTEASLLAAMEGAGRLIDAEELQQAMKDTGLGTPATRASIIETLIQRQYIYRKGKTLMPTEKGIRLIAAIPVESLRSPQLTGEWEARLARMARGEYPSGRFMEEVRAYVEELVGRIRVAKPIQAVAAEHLPGSDPAEAVPAKEGEARGRRGGNGIGTGSGKEGTKGARSRGKAAEPEGGKARAGTGEGRSAARGGTGEGRSAVRGGTGEGRSAVRAGAGEGRSAARGDAGEGRSAVRGDTGGVASSTEPVARCPRCKGEVLERPEAYACAAGGRGCGFAVRKQIAGKALTGSMVKKLLEKGRTQVLKGFVSPKSGVRFNAALFLKPEGGIGFEFEERPADGDVAEKARTAPPQIARSPAPVAAPRASAEAAAAPPDAQAAVTGSAAEAEAARTVAEGAAPPPRNAASSLGRCPLCHLGEVIAGRQAWGCARWKQGCRFLLPFEVAGHPLSEAMARQLLVSSRVGPLRGLVDEAGQRCDGELVLVLDHDSNRSQVRVRRLEPRA